MTLNEVKNNIENRVHRLVISRGIPAGIEIGIKLDAKKVLASILPIANETREKFCDFMVSEYEKLSNPSSPPFKSV